MYGVQSLFCDIVLGDSQYLLHITIELSDQSTPKVVLFQKKTKKLLRNAEPILDQSHLGFGLKPVDKSVIRR